MSRSTLLAALALTAAPFAAAGTESFSFATVDARAKALAAAPYAKEPDTVPPFFMKLEYDDVSRIVFRPDRALWAGTATPWKLQFFCPGRYHERIAKTYAVENGVATEVKYDLAAFDFGSLQIPAGTPMPDGYAGFRINGRLNPKNTWDDEFAVFVGATYFRCVPSGVDAIYGLSARAVAIDTAMASTPEEFPFFRSFWVERAPAGAKSVVVYALMDSPTCSGAYRIEMFPGPKVVTQVKASVYFRKKPARFGITPFSSMFAYGENSNYKLNDYRSEVHDSDGLLIEEKDGRRIWRPLDNDNNGDIRESVFMVSGARGFGLRQRNLDYSRYADLENQYHKRPGIWVEPGAGWPEGAIHLFELPTGEEDWDNIVMYWEPAKIPGPGESLNYEYTMTWALDPAYGDPLSRIVATRRGPPVRLGAPNARPGVVRYFVDFSAIPGVVPDTKPALRTDTSGGAAIVGARLEPNPGVGGWRATLDVRPPEAGIPYELRACLTVGDREVSERWTARPVHEKAPKPAAAVKPAAPAPAPAAPKNAVGTN